jgi:hypothetical protein
MIRISITAAAFAAIATLPFGFAVFERDPDDKDEHQIWLARAVADRLRPMRGPGDSYSDVILRLADACPGFWERTRRSPATSSLTSMRYRASFMST